VRIRNVLQEYEAHLEPTAVGKSTSARSAHGKAEWKAYGNGTQQFKVRVAGLHLSDGAVIQLAVNGQPFADLLIQNGKARYQRESERGETVPAVEAKQTLQVSYAGEILLEAEFYEE
jgi:hypothetical protein